ncbi:hypothetical protein BIW11_04988 [Tropilaelaps mercedesae]|uniref:Saposin B-type domain-containing protein n=1 Tax=Tropilaelaps mercedesae TaxID=418985 RepID=A0A1V9WYQ3_9ACAR|nr:hypothetical protein BIW11_04988 [Tropilaelaps mercedesae]
MRVTTVAFLAAALAVGAHGSRAQLPTVDSSDPRCRTLDTACQGLWIASQCGLTKKCIPRWEILPTSTVGNDTELCELCKTMVQKGRDTLLSNETQSELRQVLEGSCDILLPIEPLKGICKKLMHEFQDELNDILVSRMDAVQVCTVSGLCWESAQKTDIIERVNYLVLSEDMQKTKCEACKATLGKAISFRRFISKDTAVEAFATLCEKENDESKCLRFTHTYVNKLFGALYSAAPERTCQAFEQCPGKPVPMPDPVTTGIRDDLQCEFCEAMVHKFTAEFNNPSAKAQVKKALENICKHTGTWANECLGKLDKDFDEVYDELIVLLKPSVVCKLVGLCTASAETMPLVRLAPVSRPYYLPMARLTHAVSSPDMVNQRKLVKTKGEICETCQLIAGYIVQAVNDNTAKDNAEAVFEQVCLIVPMDASECQQFIDQYVDKIYQLLREEITVDHICRGLRVCAAPKLGRQALALQRCTVCKRIADWLYDEIAQNKSQEVILTRPERMCQAMPEEDRAQCVNIMDLDIGLINALVRLNLTSADNCITMRMCPVPRRKDAGCALCLTAVGAIFDEIKDQKTDIAILNALDRVCKVAPIDAGQCKDFNDKYQREMVNLIKQDLNAEEICTALTRCAPAFPVMLTDRTAVNTLFVSWLMDELKDNETQEALDVANEKACSVLPIEPTLCKKVVESSCGLVLPCMPKLVVAPKKEFENHCQVCSVLTDWILDEIKDDKSDAAILAAFEKGCSMIPADHTKCRNIIDTYSGILINYIKQDLSSEEICKLVGLCAIPTQTSLRKDSNNCMLCVAITSWLLDELKDNKTDASILASLERVCDVLPVDNVQCKNIVGTYGGMLFTALQQDLTFDLICKTIGLCTTPGPRRQTVKASKPGVSCELCHKVATWLIDEVKDDKTDARILAALDNVCSVIPVDPTECKNYVDSYGNALLDALKKDLSVKEVCSRLGLCAIPRSRKLTDHCATCTLIATYLIDELKDNKTDAAIVEMLEKVCSVVPMDASVCKNYVDTYSNLLIQYIKADFTADEICLELRLCNGRHAAVQRQQVRGEVCELCKVIANWLVSQVVNNKSESAILEALETVCKVISVDRTQCQNVIDDYGSLLFRLLKEETSPAVMCSVMELCGVPPASKHVPYSCTLCTTAVNWILGEIKDDKTENAILVAVEEMCKVVPTNKAPECRGYLHTYGYELLKLLAEDLSAEEICHAITVCPSQAPKRLSDNQACRMCQIVVHVVEAELNNNNTRAEFLSILDKVCSRLPSKDQTMCRNMIDVYTAYIIEMLKSFGSTKEICQTFGYCPKPPLNMKCGICMLITDIIESQLRDNQTEAEIFKFLDKVCEHLPNVDIRTCKATTEQFTDMIITLLAQTMPPRMVCESIRQCPVAPQQMVAISTPTVKTAQVKDEKCSLCKWLVNWVDNKLGDNRTEMAVKEELDKACDLLSDSSQCKAMIDDYVDRIIRMLIEYADPEKICEALEKCPKKALQLRGDEPPCQLCKYYVDELRNRLSNRSTEDQIKDELYQLCSALHVNKRQCASLVDRYTDELVKLILEHTNPEAVCQVLRACPKQITLRPEATRCEYCQRIMDFIADEVRNENTDEEIISIVEKVCDFVPEVYRTNCHRMVEIEGMVIVRMLAESVDPQSICEAIKFCPINGANVVCAWCEYTLHFIQEKLYDNATELEIQSELDKLCAMIKNPSAAKDCKEFVDFYGPSFDVIIAQKLDPSIVCPAIHACPPSHVKRKGRRPSSAQCNDCMSSLKSFRRNPLAVCNGADAQFFDKVATAKPLQK